MDFINKWLSLLRENKEVAVVTIINGIGSMPRDNGAQMLVSKSGDIADTVGGGKLEADLISKAKQAIVNKTNHMHHFNLNSNEVALSDMICGGKGDAAIYYSNERDLPILQYLSSLDDPEGWLIFPLDAKNALGFATADKVFAGSCPAELFMKINRPKGLDVIAETGGERYLIQWIAPSGRLHIMGAGHVSREIAKIADIVEMPCTVYDDRAEFVNKGKFPNAECILLEDLSSPPHVEIGEKDMIVIVTRGHLYDRDILEWALKTEAGYIGMIGSRRKIEMIFTDLLRKGCPEKKVRSVSAPIGLDIGAKTPAEIAVSIVAQLIQFRRKGS